MVQRDYLLKRAIPNPFPGTTAITRERLLRYRGRVVVAGARDTSKTKMIARVVNGGEVKPEKGANWYVSGVLPVGQQYDAAIEFDELNEISPIDHERAKLPVTLVALVFCEADASSLQALDETWASAIRELYPDAPLFIIRTAKMLWDGDQEHWLCADAVVDDDLVERVREKSNAARVICDRECGGHLGALYHAVMESHRGDLLAHHYPLTKVCAVS